MCTGGTQITGNNPVQCIADPRGPSHNPQWNPAYPLPSCALTQCSALSDSHGVWQTGIYTGQQAALVCRSGYLPSGTPFAYCIAALDGSARSVWDPTQDIPTCQPVECPPLPAVTGGYWSYTNPGYTPSLSSTSTGNAALLYCDFGYVLQSFYRNGYQANAAYCIASPLNTPEPYWDTEEPL